MSFRFVLLIMLFISNVLASDFNVKNLSVEQIEMLKEIKRQGQDLGFGYTLMAIAIKESRLGEYMVNLDTKDFGLYQANIKTVLSRQNIKDTVWNRNVFASRLVSDFEFATQNAIEELTFWQKIHKNDWRKIWGSYNAGYNYNSKKAQEYSRQIALIIRELKKLDV